MAGRIRRGQQYVESSMNTQQLFRTYSKAAYEARQRYAKIAQAFPGSETVAVHKGDFGTVAEIRAQIRAAGIKPGTAKERRAIANELAAVRRYLQSSSSKVAGYARTRERTVKSFQEHGYGFVNKKNLDSIQKFMADARSKGLISLYGSQAVLNAGKNAIKNKLTAAQVAANMQRWMSPQYSGRTLRYNTRLGMSSSDL